MLDAKLKEIQAEQKQL